MRSTFPANSQPFESYIRNITQIIINTAPEKIAFVILFGSFARGTWVRDRYSEGNSVYEYASDFDFLVITNAKKKDEQGKEIEDGISAYDLERKILRNIDDAEIARQAHRPHFVIEPIDYVNHELERGQYFFSDIKKEGILLFDSGKLKLSEARVLSEKEVREIAKADYEHWFDRATSFLRDSKNTFQIPDYKSAAFYLHQATEGFYNCALLVLTGYKPKTHDLIDLNKLCSAQSNDFLTIFPLATDEQKESFKVLNKSYVDSRYNKNFIVSKEQLEYLTKRVEGLKETVEKICKNKI
ncbi:MAG: HEPN domain-containing protein [Pseudomonadota bacterium]